MTRKNTLLALAILIAVIIAGIAVGALAPIAVLPSDIKITPPDQSLPEAVKSLSGKWYGKWAWLGGGSQRGSVGQMGWESLIIVEKIDKESAQIVNAWGEYQTRNGTCHCAPDWRRIEKAKVTYSEGKASIDFTTPPYRPLEGLNPSHNLSGTVGPQRRKFFTFSFTLDQSQPNLLQGRFLSAGGGGRLGGELVVNMKKMD